VAHLNRRETVIKKLDGQDLIIVPTLSAPPLCTELCNLLPSIS
jgi:hypothetical protein